MRISAWLNNFRKKIIKIFNPKRLNPKYRLLSYKIEKELKRYKEREKLIQFLAYPRKEVVLILLIFLVIIFAIPYAYVRVFNQVDIINCPLFRDNGNSSLYKTVWAVQASLTAAALPILIFIIDLTKDVKQAATRSAEVLIRETSIFPVIIFSMTGCIALGLYLRLSEYSVIFYFGLSVLFSTVSLTIYSYYKALALIFEPAKLRLKSIELLKEKMSRLMDYSIQTRLGANFFIKKLSEMQAEYNPFNEDEKSNYVLKSRKLGVIDDIDLVKLEDFVRYLFERVSAIAGEPEIATDTSPSEEAPEGPEIFILKTYRDELIEDRNGLIAISRNVTLSDAVSRELEDKLERQGIFKIRRTV